MKMHWPIWGVLWLMTFFLLSISVVKEGGAQEYIYLLRSDGGKLYQLAEGTAGNKKASVKKEIRRMELVSPGTILEIQKGASVSLTCGGCRVLNLTHKDSPFEVKMEDFKKGGSTPSKLVEYFTAALNNYIHPDSKPSSKANLGTRGLPDALKRGICKDLWPPDNGNIMFLEPITFEWGAKGTHFFLEIKELGANHIVYSEKREREKVDVPMGIFKPSGRYEWFLLEEETGEKCSSTFGLLSEDESSRIMEIVNHLPTLLPPGVDMETKRRLQAGYFLSEGLNYDARRWLEKNGIPQQR